MNHNEEVLIVKKLSHRYNKDWVIENVDFSITKNEIVGLLGSNGAGKSTTMNSLCGILTPTKGEIIVDGFSLKKKPIEVKKRIGFLPQKAPLYPDLTVNEYLRFCAHFKSIPRANIQRSLDRVKGYCNLEEYGKRLIKNLSGGYQQRVGIAQAIIHRPELVVLDEPTNGLDPVQINEVRNLIREISRRSTVLISTHILSEVKELCNRIIMMEKGRIIFNGSLVEFNDQIKSNTLFIHAKNLPKVERLKEIPGVIEASLIDPNQAKVKIDTSQLVPEEIIARSIHDNWEAEEIYKEKVSLDSVFAKLSNRELKTQ